MPFAQYLGSQLLVVFIGCLILSFNCLGQSLSGVSGLLNSPSAELYPDKTFYIGASYIPTGYHRRTYGINKGRVTENPGSTTFINLTLLPFVEIMFRYTHEINLKVTPESKYFPDRMLAVRIRLLEEKKYWPAITLGSHDPTAAFNLSCRSCTNFLASYVVFTKNIDHNNYTFGITLGYGDAFFDLPVKEFKGLFGGVKVKHKYLPNIEFLADYDADFYNVGVSGYFLNRIHLIVGLRNLSSLTGVIAYRKRL